MEHEKRLIDANDLWQKTFVCEEPGDFRKAIENAPTVDAVEVVHGRWILKSRIYKMFDDVDEEFYVECNLCNREEPVCFEFGEQQMLDYAKRHYPYCHCGAKMDGGNDL